MNPHRFQSTRSLRARVFYASTYRSVTQHAVLDECPLVPQSRRDLYGRALPIVALSESSGVLSATSPLAFNWLNKGFAAFVSWWDKNRKVAIQAILRPNRNPVYDIGAQNVLLDLVHRDTGQARHRLSAALQLNNDAYRPLSAVVEIKAVSLQIENELMTLSRVLAQAWFSPRPMVDLADIEVATPIQ